MPGRVTKEELLLEQWKASIDLHKHEDQLSWSKFSYFTTLNAGLLAALGYLWTNQSTLDFETLGFVLSSFGFLVSLGWFLTQERGRAYHKFWIEKAKESEFQGNSKVRGRKR